ncbi:MULTISPECIES: alpha/beta hydrolase [Listeria]|uniref:alpha/beta hydrolase n=1 Tax=Listeria TaxID=1637 RepID=UPI000B5887DC|nr:MULTISPECIES: alpha/beta hydrolase [Listeria]
MKKIIFLILALCLLFLGFSFIFQTMDKRNADDNKAKQTVKAKADVKKPREIAIPTLFVHGYAGTKNSLGGMIKRLESQNDATKSLVITVKSDGTLDITGNYDKFSHNPLIQVLFENNKSSMVNQTEWLKTVGKALKSDYHITKMNAVGHSMGGVSLTNYVEQTGNDAAYPTLEKLVLIGAPLNGLAIGNSAYDLTDTGPKTETERYANFIQHQASIPKSLEVYTIAGDKLDGTKSDGSVPVSSALSGKFIFSDILNYEEKVFEGSNAEHSKLHENPEVDAVIGDFLWISNG